MQNDFLAEAVSLGLATKVVEYVVRKIEVLNRS